MALELHSLERDKVFDLVHCKLDTRPDPPLRAKVSEERGFQLLEGCGALFLWANYTETCHLNRMRPDAYLLLKQGFGVAVMVRNLNCVVRGLLLDMLLDKVRPRTFAGPGRVRILEREYDISLFVRHIDGLLAVVRRHHEQG